MNSKKNYAFNCSESDSSTIDKIVERSRRINYITFMKNVNLNDLIRLFPFYNWEKTGKGLKLKDDYAVSFYTSKHLGKKIYFLEHSRIEYIFA